MRQPNGQFAKGSHWRPPQPFREADWLEREYVQLKRSAGDIAREFGVGDTAIHFWLKRHSISTRSVSEARALKHWGAAGSANPMFGKRGPEVPSWRGGCTPERQAFHGSQEWADASMAVWRRDAGTCRRCALNANGASDTKFDVHHIVPFAVREMRATVSNLVLLCRPCHRFVHSKRNAGREHLPQN
jgi:hypothetical protein